MSRHLESWILQLMTRHVDTCGHKDTVWTPEFLYEHQMSGHPQTVWAVKLLSGQWTLVMPNVKIHCLDILTPGLLSGQPDS